MLLDELPLVASSSDYATRLASTHVLKLVIDGPGFSNWEDVAPFIPRIREVMGEDVAVFEAYFGGALRAWTLQLPSRIAGLGFALTPGRPIADGVEGWIYASPPASRIRPNPKQPPSLDAIIEAPIWRALSAAVFFAERTMPGKEEAVVASLAPLLVRRRYQAEEAAGPAHPAGSRARGAAVGETAAAWKLFDELREDGPGAVAEFLALGAGEDVRVLGRAWRTYAGGPRGPEHPAPLWWTDEPPLADVERLVRLARHAGVVASGSRKLNAVLSRRKTFPKDGAFSRLALPAADARKVVDDRELDLDVVDIAWLGLRFGLEAAPLLGTLAFAAPMSAACAALGMLFYNGSASFGATARWGLRAISTAGAPPLKAVKSRVLRVFEATEQVCGEIEIPQAIYHGIPDMPLPWETDVEQGVELCFPRSRFP